MQQKKLTTLCLFGGLVVATTNSWKSALAAAIDNNNKKNGEVDAATLELGVRVGADDAAVVAGAAEEEDFCDEASDCALELKQLRALKVHTAAQASEEVADTAAGALFGPEAVGVNMWTPESWARSLDLLEKSHSNTSAGCELQTGATCAIFSCKESRGPTECKDLLCQCASGWCAKDGICLPSLRAVCLTDSGGTCYADGCDASRGPTTCSAGKCLCEAGSCAYEGRCFQFTDTGGTCRALPCDSSRGPTTCHQGRCLCQSGHVAVSGACVPLEP